MGCYGGDGIKIEKGGTFFLKGFLWVVGFLLVVWMDYIWEGSGSVWYGAFVRILMLIMGCGITEKVISVPGGGPSRQGNERLLERANAGKRRHIQVSIHVTYYTHD